MTSTPQIEIQSAVCRAIFVFDIGKGVDFAACLRLVPELVRARPPAERGRPTSLRVSTPALRLTLPVGELAVEGRTVEPSADASVYDFGAISVTLSLPAGETLDDLRDLACALAGNPDLAAAARALVTKLVERIAASVEALEVAAVLEDYLVFEVTEFRSPVAIEDMAATYGQEFARILRAERGTLSAQEVTHATSTAVARTPDDMVLLDWNAALIFNPRPHDVREVLELANVQLLELRFLDLRLDDALHGSYEVVSKPLRWRPVFLPDSMRHAARRIAQRQVEAALLFERINNALKLVGDQYLARVYRQAARRFELEAWNEASVRKLATLEGIYDKVHDRAAVLRAEMMEWIVIILVIASIVIPFIV